MLEARPAITQNNSFPFAPVIAFLKTLLVLWKFLTMSFDHLLLLSPSSCQNPLSSLPGNSAFSCVTPTKANWCCQILSDVSTGSDSYALVTLLPQWFLSYDNDWPGKTGPLRNRNMNVIETANRFLIGLRSASQDEAHTWHHHQRSQTVVENLQLLFC